MNEVEQQLVEEIKQLFLKYKLKECSKKVTENDFNKSFLCHQTLQLYKGLSLFESSLQKEGFICFDQIIEESEKLKGGKVDEIDVVIWVHYLIQIQYTDLNKSEIRSTILYKVSEDYKVQNQYKDNYRKGIYLLGKGIHLYLNTNQDCISYLEEALTLLDDFKQDIMNFFCWIYYRKNKNNLVEEWCVKLYNLNPCYPGISTKLAIIVNDKGQKERAEKLYKEAEQLCPNNQKILYKIASFYGQQGNDENEREYYEKAYNLQPRSAQSCCKYGSYIYRGKKEKEKAVQILNEGLKIDPTFASCYEELSNIFSSENEEKEAINYLQKCVELYPDEGFNYFRLADLLERYSLFGEAIRNYKKSIEIMSYGKISILARSRIAQCYQITGITHKALGQYFNACNFRSIYYNCDSDIQKISNLINSKYQVSFKQKITLIKEQQGICLERFLDISRNIADINLKNLFLYRLDSLRATLSIIAYQKYVQDQLTFQDQLSHIDLYFD